MNNTSRPDKVKPQKRILPFPEEDSSIEERLARLEAGLAEVKADTDEIKAMHSALCEHLGLKSKKKAEKNAPAPGAVSEPRRLKRLRLLHMHMSTISDLKGTFLPISGDPMYRIYFVEDHSWLWYSDDGRLYAKIENGDSKTCKAARLDEAIRKLAGEISALKKQRNGLVFRRKQIADFLSHG